jgi:iron(III) transport system ATP-binding protein
LLTITNLSKTYESKDKNPVPAVSGISLAVPEGKLFTLLGPSGCGKTTTLRCVAGLERPDEGEIMVGDRVLYSSEKGIRLRANERGLGMVFQSYAIWPHMNVFSNVAFPLTVLPRNQRSSRKEIAERVERVLTVVQLDHLAHRQATDLSGGQQQRLALARALIMQPPLLLLDEPLSNLDAKLREEMRFELKRLQRDLGVTAVYVTHDQVEALAMSDVIAVMRDGVIEQVGKPREIYEWPASRFVADFIGTSNFIDGKVERKESGDVYCVATSEGTLRATSQLTFEVGDPVVISVRPEHIGLAEGDSTVNRPNAWRGRVQTRAFLGESVDHVVTVGELEIRARENPSMSFPEQTGVTLTFPVGRCTLIPGND